VGEREEEMLFDVAGGELRTKEIITVEVPVQDVQSGKWEECEEEFAVHPSMQCSLLACEKRVCFLGQTQGWLQMQTRGGALVKARVSRQRGGPVLVTKGLNGCLHSWRMLNYEAVAHGSRRKRVHQKESKKGSASQKFGSTEEREGSREPALPEVVKKKRLSVLHTRLGHALRDRLFMGLGETGIRLFTL